MHEPCLHGRFAGGGTELLDDVFEDLLIVLITEKKVGDNRDVSLVKPTDCT